VIGSRKWVVVAMIEAVAESRDARHEDVAPQLVAAGARGSFHLFDGSSALPVVNIVENGVEPEAVQRGSNLSRIVTVGDDALHAFRQRGVRVSMQNGYLVAGGVEFLDQDPADEQCAADYKNPHG
jgi:hypothetical protein